MSKATLNLLQIEGQLLKSETFLFKTLREEALRRGANQDNDIIHAIDILTNQTYESYTQKGLKMNQKYQVKLKAISILTYFYGSSEYSLNVLASKLSLSSEQCLKMLMELSISKLILVAIDQIHNTVIIRKSSIRERESLSKMGAVNQKLNQIKDKNYNIERYLNDLIETTQGKTKKLEKSFESPMYEGMISNLRSSKSHGF